MSAEQFLEVVLDMDVEIVLGLEHSQLECSGAEISGMFALVSDHLEWLCHRPETGDVVAGLPVSVESAADTFCL